MTTKNVNDIIRKALNLYDNQNEKYKKQIETEDFNINRDTTEINLNKDMYKYQVLGVYLPYSNIWLWSWMIPDFTSKEIILSKKLLDYGLKQNNDNLLDDTESYSEIQYLKVQLVNSRFIIDKKFQLDVHLSICSYLLKDNILFIRSKKKYLTKDNYLITYFLVYK